jgi:hypothetical protein
MYVLAVRTLRFRLVNYSGEGWYARAGELCARQRDTRTLLEMRLTFI